MKYKHLILLFFLLSCCVLNASTYYVTANSLNIRSQPDANSQILGKLYKNNQIDVIEYNSHWAKIKYQDRIAYINKSYIKPTDTSNAPPVTHTREPLKKTIWSNILVWSLLILLVILTILRYARDGEYFEGFALWAYTGIFLLICIVELLIGYLGENNYEIYFFGLNNPSESIRDDIAMVLITGSIFIFLVYNQLKSFLNILHDLEYNSEEVNYSLYKYSTGISIIAGIIALIFFEEYFIYVPVFWGICSVIQAIIICKTTSPQFGYGVIISVVLILGSVTCIIMTVLLVWAYIANRLLKLVDKFDISGFLEVDD